MNRLIQAFAERVAAGRKSLLPYVTAGYPDVATTLEVLRRVDAAACPCVELGIPFSDPIADGPVIQESFARALAGGFRLERLFAALHERRAEFPTALVVMVSYSIVYRRTPGEFVAQARRAGIDGLIVPDLALEEVDELAAICRGNEMALVLIAAPPSDAARRRRIAALSSPFVYYQSVTGVTGERERLPDDLLEQVRRLRAESGRPVCVGFGLARPEHVAAVCAVADGAIVGSAIVRRMTAAVEGGQGAAQIGERVRAFVAELAGALA